MCKARYWCSHEVSRNDNICSYVEKIQILCNVEERIHSKLLLGVALSYNVVKDSQFSWQYNDGSTLEFPRLLVLICNSIENAIPPPQKKRSLCKNCILEWRGKENISREATLAAGF